MKHIIGVTLGDPSGIGPEIVAKLLTDKDFVKQYPFIPVGPEFILRDAFINILGITPPELTTFHVPDVDPFPVEYGKHSALYGDCAMKCVRRAVELAQEGSIQAIATSPINKHSVELAGYEHHGHTEYLAALCGVNKYSMMLASPTLRVIPVTIHIPLKDVPGMLTTEKILTGIRNAAVACRMFGITSPRIAVTGLNPHAGDAGTIGDEEAPIIVPAIEAACREGINAYGPCPADALFAKTDKFDAAVAMYHDQALIPVKMTGFGSTVNITLNLPIIRTSVDHGTAFDIAGKGIADESSLRHAVIMAHEMAAWQG